MSDDSDTKISFARYEVDGESPTIVIGIPKAAWEHMHDGKTHHFDLTRIGVAVKLVFFGGPTSDSVMETLTEIVTKAGKVLVDARDQDFSIKFKPDEPPKT